jgi:hypothetical protein
MADLTENGEHRVRIALVQKPADSEEQASRFAFVAMHLHLTAPPLQLSAGIADIYLRLLA